MEAPTTQTRIGLFATGLDTYRNQFDGLRDRLNARREEIAAGIGRKASRSSTPEWQIRPKRRSRPHRRSPGGRPESGRQRRKPAAAPIRKREFSHSATDRSRGHLRPT